jgi:predicted ATP-grasp superfamily ATP-dependent carboligase
MSTLAMEVDATLKSLDAETAEKFSRLVRDAVALVQPNGRGAILDEDYFNSVIGGFADLEFARPEQGEFPTRTDW